MQNNKKYVIIKIKGADKTDLNVKNQLAVYWHKELKELERSTGHHEGEIERSLNDSYFIY